MTEKKRIIVVTVLAVIIAFLICLLIFKVPQRIKRKFISPADKEINVYEEKIDIEGLDRKVTIFFVADAHICLCDERDEEIKENCDSRYIDFIRDQRGSEENFSLLMDYVRKENPDLVIFGGDITDAATYASIEYAKNEIDKLSCPYDYCMGNHDFAYGSEYFSDKAYSDYFTRFDSINEVKAGYRIIKFDEFNILVVDDKNYQVCDEIVDAIEELKADNKPVIIAGHVPFSTDFGGSDIVSRTNEVWGSMEEGKSRVLIGDGAVEPEGVTKEYKDFVFNDPKVKAVLAGHIHFFRRDNLDEDTLQLVTNPAYERGVIKLTLY